MNLPLRFVLCMFFLVTPGLAQVTYSKVDRATVRVMAVQGVVPIKVKAPADARNDKSFTIAVVESGHGSGVVLTYDGIIATAQHVIDDAEFVAVKFPGKERAVIATVIYQNKKHDVAFLKVPGKYEAFIGLPEVNPQMPVRTRIFALGYPFDGTRTHPQSNAGVIAGELPSGELQLGLSANPGNSGGPLIDEKGNLLGLVIRSADPRKGAQGIAVAVPVKEVKKFYDRRVVNSPRLAKARKYEKEMQNESPVAQVIARFASVSTMKAAIDYIEKSDQDFRFDLTKAERLYSKNPDFLALLSSHYWNESVIRFSLDGRNWRQPLDRARGLAKKAVAYDSRVLNSSPFLYSALGKSAKKPRLAKTKQSAPRKVAGFRLGWSLHEARDACTIEGLKFEKTAVGYQCSHSPTSESMSGPVQVRFCEGRICRIDVIDRPSRALSSLWVSQFKSTYKFFKGKYGAHDTKDLRFPSRCRANVLSCLEKGQARIIYRWSWNRRKLVLTLGRLSGKPTMRITLTDEAPRKTQGKKKSSRKLVPQLAKSGS